MVFDNERQNMATIDDVKMKIWKVFAKENSRAQILRTQAQIIRAANEISEALINELDDNLAASQAEDADNESSGG
jgi:hypothetical protein